MPFQTHVRASGPRIRIFRRSGGFFLTFCRDAVTRVLRVDVVFSPLSRENTRPPMGCSFPHGNRCSLGPRGPAANPPPQRAPPPLTCSGTRHASASPSLSPLWGATLLLLLSLPLFGPGIFHGEEKDLKQSLRRPSPIEPGAHSFGACFPLKVYALCAFYRNLIRTHSGCAEKRVWGDFNFPRTMIFFGHEIYDGRNRELLGPTKPTKSHKVIGNSRFKTEFE